MVFTGIAVAFSGGFIMIWLYGQDWFLNFNFLGENVRDLFQMHPINLSVAVWVGFIALFGIATDDGVVMATYLTQTFERNIPENKKEVRAAVVEAGGKTYSTVFNDYGNDYIGFTTNFNINRSRK